MATIVQPPFIVPRPSEETFWQGKAAPSKLLAGLLTAVTIYGSGGQVPTRQWHFDTDTGETVWQGQPVDSAVIGLLTAVKVYGQGGQVPATHWRFEIDESSRDWQRTVTRNVSLLGSLTVATPFAGPPWKFGIVDDAVWQGQPDSSAVLSLLTSVKVYGAGGQAPASRWRHDTDETPRDWRQTASRNVALFNSLTAGTPLVNPPWKFAVVDDAVLSWQPQRNSGLLATSVVAQSPLVNPPWKFSVLDEAFWQGQPDNSAVLQLLTAPKFYGAGGQAPTKRWRYDYLIDEPLWLGRPASSALLAPLLTAAGQVRSRQWLFGLDEPFRDWQHVVTRNGTLLPPPPTLPPNFDPFRTYLNAVRRQMTHLSAALRQRDYLNPQKRNRSYWG